MTTTPAPLLELNQVRRTFDGLMAVNQVSFAIQPGEILGLIGPNGAGKTTLINMISGLMPVTSGEIFFQGQTVTDWPAHRMCQMGIARTYQNIRLLDEMTVLDNVLTARHLQMAPASRAWRWLLPRRDPDERQQRHASFEMLARLGLEDLRQRYASELSYGDQRRVELARALATHPKLLLLDEPTAGMNRHETSQLGELFLALRDEGLTILVIEHDMALIAQVCDRVAVLNFGSVIGSGTPQEIRHNPQVIEAYLGDEE